MEKLSLSLEKYLIAIYKLSLENKKVTPKLTSQALGYNAPSTLEGIKALSCKGFAEYYPYKEIKLTKSGIEYAKNVINKKKIISEFMERFLFLEKDELEESVESVQYGLSDILIERFSNFIDFARFCSCEDAGWLVGFKKYLAEGEMTQKCAICIEKTAETGCKVKCKGCEL